MVGESGNERILDMRLDVSHDTRALLLLLHRGFSLQAVRPLFLFRFTQAELVCHLILFLVRGSGHMGVVRSVIFPDVNVV